MSCTSTGVSGRTASTVCAEAVPSAATSAVRDTRTRRVVGTPTGGFWGSSATNVAWIDSADGGGTGPGAGPGAGGGGGGTASAGGGSAIVGGGSKSGGGPAPAGGGATL